MKGQLLPSLQLPARWCWQSLRVLVVVTTCTGSSISAIWRSVRGAFRPLLRAVAVLAAVSVAGTRKMRSSVKLTSCSGVPYSSTVAAAPSGAAARASRKCKLGEKKLISRRKRSPAMRKLALPDRLAAPRARRLPELLQALHRPARIRQAPESRLQPTPPKASHRHKNPALQRSAAPPQQPPEAAASAPLSYRRSSPALETTNTVSSSLSRTARPLRAS